LVNKRLGTAPRAQRTATDSRRGEFYGYGEVMKKKGRKGRREKGKRGG
jgi:hypothetical protein